MVLFRSEIIGFEPDLWLLLTPILMKGKGSGRINMSQHEVQWGKIWLQPSRAVPEVAIPSPHCAVVLGLNSSHPALSGCP